MANRRFTDKEESHIAEIKGKCVNHYKLNWKRKNKWK